MRDSEEASRRDTVTGAGNPEGVTHWSGRLRSRGAQVLLWGRAANRRPPPLGFWPLPGGVCHSVMETLFLRRVGLCGKSHTAPHSGTEFCPRLSGLEGPLYLAEPTPRGAVRPHESMSYRDLNPDQSSYVLSVLRPTSLAA